MSVYYIFTLAYPNEMYLQPLNLFWNSWPNKLLWNCILLYFSTSLNLNLHRWLQRVRAKICFPRIETTGITNRTKHWNSSLMNFLQAAECTLAGKWETPGGYSLSGPPNSMGCIPGTLPNSQSEQPRKISSRLREQVEKSNDFEIHGERSL